MDSALTAVEVEEDMSLQKIVDVRHGLALSPDEQRRIEHHLQALERRLVHFPGPTAKLAIELHPDQRQFRADLRLQLGPLGSHLISHQAAETADRAVRLAVEHLERQLERRLARQRGESTFGTPSRRLPKQLRPSPPTADTRAESGEE